jgi:gliding motility-associated-like protein
MAQPPYTACFSLDVVKGCAPLTVTATSCSGNPSVQYSWGDGLPNPNPFNPVHTFTTVGTFTVKQTVNTVGGATPTSSTTTTVQVMPLDPPNFKILICRNFAVSVRITENIYDKYVINWGDGALNDTINGNSTITHTTTAGDKTVQVKGIYLSSSACSSPTTSTLIYPVGVLIKPDLTILKVDRQSSVNGQITLTLFARKGQKYYLEQSTGNNSSYGPPIDSLPISAGDNMVTKTVTNLNTAANQYCFRFRSYDDCGNSILSEEVCSNIIHVTAQPDQNEITWSSPFMGTPGSFGKYNLITSSGQVANVTSPYIDNPVICKTNYFYYMVTELSILTTLGSPVLSISDDTTVTAISNLVPPAIQNLNSTVNGSAIALTWDVPVFVPAASTYNILRSDGATFTSNTNSFTDNSVNVNSQSYCYTVQYTPCTIPSPVSISTCPVLLSGNETGGINLTWTSYNCSSGVPDYTLERLDPNTNTVISSQTLVTSPYQDTQADPNAPVLKYRINTSCGASSTSVSNILEINHELKLFLPTAFTPDNDGFNDIFIAKGNYIKDFKMTIFNRWGEIVFFSDRFDVGWDGNYKGEIASMDAYAYRVEATDSFGNKLTRKGTVTLLR